MSETSLSVKLCGVDFKNPVLAASGTFGSAAEYSRFIDISRLGGVTVKGVTLEPRRGNSPPRIAETPSGILNSVGLQNPGADYFIERELPNLQKFDNRILVNINGNTIEEYCRIAEKFHNQAIDMLELNISCPNVKAGGASFGAYPDMVYKVTKAVKSAAAQPLIVKLTPNTTDIGETARAAEEGGCDAISLINTILGMAIDIRTRRPALGNVVGGLSGPAVKPVALRMVWQAAQSVKVPVIGMGGITTWEDAVEFLLAGASCIAVGTGSLMDPDTCIRIVDGLARYLEANHIDSVTELTGGLVLEAEH